MSALEEPNPDLGPHPVVQHHPDDDTIEKKNISEIEQAHDADLDKGDHTRYDKVDKELAQYINSEAVEISPAENTRLRRMIDKRVLAIMITTYFLQAIDKGTLSFAAIMGIQADTGLVGSQYSWLTTCIYITILLVEYPQNLIIARVPIAKYLSIMIVCWGTVLAATAACNNFTGMVVVRTLLGLFESACQPAFVVLSSIWYKREEQASRVTYWVCITFFSSCLLLRRTTASTRSSITQAILRLQYKLLVHKIDQNQGYHCVSPRCSRLHLARVGSRECWQTLNSG